MKKSLVYRRCEQLLETLRQQGYEEFISLNDLAKWITKVIGGHPQTIRNYFNYLRQFEMIYPAPKPNLFRIDHEYPKRVQLLIRRVVKSGPLSEFLDEG